MTRSNKNNGQAAAAALLSSFREHVNATASAHECAERAVILRERGDSSGARRAEQEARKHLRKAIEIELRRPRAANDPRP